MFRRTFPTGVIRSSPFLARRAPFFSESTRMLLGLAIGIILMIILVSKTKVHTFIALLVAALVTALIGGMSPADLTLADGTTLNFSGVRSMTATAYTAGHGGADYTTATGTFVEVGTVAVDRSVIPLGTEMFIITNDGIVYGTAVARDTGVRGNVIDLYYDTYRECIEFGRRSCTVYILG